MTDTGGRNAEGQPPKPNGRILRAADFSGLEDAKSAIEDAKRQAAKIRSAAEAVAQKKQREAIEEGRRAGAKEAARIVAETSAKADRYLASINDQVAELVLETVEKILGSFDRKELVLRAATHAVSKLRRDKQLTIYVAPALVADLRLRLETELGKEQTRPLPTVQGDPKLSAGACILASELGFVEAGIDAQLAAIKAGLQATTK